VLLCAIEAEVRDIKVTCWVRGVALAFVEEFI
jgi:hypothetical protein